MRPDRTDTTTPLDPDNFAVIIPARFASSRFPGKPLADIAGQSLIERVWRQCIQAVPASQVIVATDDDRIRTHCEGFGADVEMTSDQCATGTDRVAQVVEQRGLDYAINVQGDEPFVRPEDITAVRDRFLANDGQRVVNAMAAITSEAEFTSLAVPKVVFDQQGQLLYMSRAAIPGNKAARLINAWKQICIYGFSRGHLAKFAQQLEKTPFEAIEDIEILRFLELGISVQMLSVSSGTIAVDFPEDIERALALLEGTQ